MHIKQGWLRVVTFLFLWMLVVAFFQFAAHVLSGRSWNERIGDTTLDDHLLNMALALAGTAVTILFFKKFVDREPLSDVGLTRYKAGFFFGLGAAVGAGIISGGFLLLWWMNEIVPFQNELNASNMLKDVVLYLFVSFNEELMMRGYVQVNLTRSMNKYIAIIVSSSLFAVMHIFNFGITDLALINLTLSGILLGVNYLYMKNIWYSAGLHFTWNYTQGFIFGFHVSGIENPSLWEVKYDEPDLWNGGVFGFEGSLMCTILLLVSIMAIYFYFRKHTYAMLTPNLHPG